MTRHSHRAVDRLRLTFAKAPALAWCLIAVACQLDSSVPIEDSGPSPSTDPGPKVPITPPRKAVVDLDRDAGGGDPEDAGTPEPTACSKDDECDNELFCDGDEHCVAGRCVNAPSNYTACPGRLCDEAKQTCEDCEDQDGDGYRVKGCAPNGTPFDCDDGDANIHPEGREVCGAPDSQEASADEDCNPQTFFAKTPEGLPQGQPQGRPENGDGDPDNDFEPSEKCLNRDPWSGRIVSQGKDCDDGDRQRHGRLAETCDELDNDCDHRIDEDDKGGEYGLQGSYFSDADGDGRGDPKQVARSCNVPANYLTNSDDCDDSDARRFAGNPEVCDGVDNDCNDQIDDGLSGAPSCPGAVFECRGRDGWRITNDCGGDSLDCDGQVNNCCEVPVDVLNCGACGNSCTFSCEAHGCDELKAIAAGGNHSCAISDAGYLACWGRNDEGRLGNDTADQSTPPSRVVMLSAVVQAAGGDQHSCAIAGEQRQLYCWGSNAEGQCGYATNQPNAATRRPIPVQSPGSATGLSGVAKVATGLRHSCAVLLTGAVYCWGQEGDGRLGDDLYEGTSNIPEAAHRDNGAIDDAVDVALGFTHSCAVTREGAVDCWGKNDLGQLGNGYDLDRAGTAQRVLGVSGVTSLAAGPDHTCAVSQGEVYCWGDNGYGQLGREDAGDGKPGPVPQLADIRALACGDGFSCALAADGSVYCWGSNDEGERGDAEASSSAQVKRVNLGGVRAIAAGYKHVCALTERAEVYCWGRNRFGQLGQTIDGQFTPVPTPIGRLTQPIP